jgi:hypothetical protein
MTTSVITVGLSLASLGCVLGLACGELHAHAAEPALQLVGVARVDITPSEPIRLTGYAARKTNSVGIEQNLWAKALAIGTDADGPVVLVTLDLCGIAERTYRVMLDRLQAQAKLQPAQVAMACSHTHSGPCTTDWAPNIFAQDIPPEQQAAIDRYTATLVDKVEQVALAALRARQPARLAWAQGQVGFAMNRRSARAGGYVISPNTNGPVDRSLPMLCVTEPGGQIRAVWVNYACHCTTLGAEFNKVCGDWAGFAQQAIERELPGAIGLVTIGCGGDANPHPRGGPDHGLALARQHGDAIAAEVKRLLQAPLRPVGGPVRAQLRRLDLPFASHFSRAEWEHRATQPGIVGYHARKNLARLDRGEALPRTLPYWVQAWNFGRDLVMVFLPGEVVVDYALRLKQELDGSRLWLTAYANSVPCYIPSRRILTEGGYEAEDSMWYYDRPARLAPEVEELIVQAVHKVVPAGFARKP